MRKPASAEIAHEQQKQAAQEKLPACDGSGIESSGRRLLKMLPMAKNRAESTIKPSPMGEKERSRPPERLTSSTPTKPMIQPMSFLTVIFSPLQKKCASSTMKMTFVELRMAPLTPVVRARPI